MGKKYLIASKSLSDVVIKSEPKQDTVVVTSEPALVDAASALEIDAVFAALVEAEVAGERLVASMDRCNELLRNNVRELRTAREILAKSNRMAVTTS